MGDNLYHPPTGASHFQKSPRVYPSCSRLILETAFALRGEYGVGNMEDFHPHPVDLEKRGVFLGDQESVIFCWFSKTENGWASCLTNQSLRRFSANSSQLRTRFEMRQRPRVWHAQGHEGPAEKFRRRICFKCPASARLQQLGFLRPLQNVLRTLPARRQFPDLRLL